MAYQLHQRAEWLALGSKGMSGPSQSMSAVRGIVIHYNGGNANLAGGDARYAQVIASMNDGYWNSRGYALGYNWMCAPDGDLWIARGTDIRCAANGCQEVNVPWVAIQVTTTSIPADATPQQHDALKNQWIPQIRAWYGNDLAVHVVGHRDINPMCSNPTGTPCPGVPIYAKVKAGFYDTPGITPIPTTPGDEEMSILIASSDGTAEQKNQWFLLIGGQVHPLPTNQTRTDVVSLGSVPATGAPIKSQGGQPFRNLTVSDIQQLINLNWSGPRGVFATVGGYTIPADPALIAANAAKVEATAAKDNAASADSNAAQALISVGPDLKTAVAAIPTTPGSGSGASLAQVEGALKRQKITLDLSAESATVDVTPAT